MADIVAAVTGVKAEDVRLIIVSFIAVAHSHFCIGDIPMTKIS
jgi:hypothetical protein